MSNVLLFEPLHVKDARANLDQFIKFCRYEIDVFGPSLDWEAAHWPEAGVTFGHLGNTSRKPGKDKLMREPFLDFAKAYFRYHQGVSPNKGNIEMASLRCVERALVNTGKDTDVFQIDVNVLDEAVNLAMASFSEKRAFSIGRELMRLAKFLSENHLIPGWIEWKSPVRYPDDPRIRTGKKARQLREERLPDEDVIYALADIFASNPKAPRDIFTTSVTALLLCGPTRISEVLSLPVDCEVWEKKRDGQMAYGLRVRARKGGDWFVKWIPDPMVPLAQEAISRIRNLTAEARKIASWIEQHPDQLYLPEEFSDVGQDDVLDAENAAYLAGLAGHTLNIRRSGLHQMGLRLSEGITPKKINDVLRKYLPKRFPFFDQESDLKYSRALFCMQRWHLHRLNKTSPCMIWKPTANEYNLDLSSGAGERHRSVFDRHGFNDGMQKSLHASSHQFRRLIDTYAQRGGLSQQEIARWAGRSDIKQNRAYDHMSEFELVQMIRDHDPSLSLDVPLEQLAEQISHKVPMTHKEFNATIFPTAHVTEYGFCVHDFVISPCQRFRDCLNCSEQICIKGDRRVERIEKQLEQVSKLRADAEAELEDGGYGVEKWVEVHRATEERLTELVSILRSPTVPGGAIVKLKNDTEFSPWRRAVDFKVERKEITDEERNLLLGVPARLGGENG